MICVICLRLLINDRIPQTEFCVKFLNCLFDMELILEYSGVTFIKRRDRVNTVNTKKCESYRLVV